MLERFLLTTVFAGRTGRFGRRFSHHGGVSKVSVRFAKALWCCRGEPKCNGNVGHGIRIGDDGDRAGCAWCRWRVARPASAGVMSEHSAGTE